MVKQCEMCKWVQGRHHPACPETKPVAGNSSRRLQDEKKILFNQGYKDGINTLRSTSENETYALGWLRGYEASNPQKNSENVPPLSE